MSTEKPAIWWIRRDLRLTDNPTLTAAHAGNRPVIPLFIQDPVLENSPYVGPRRLNFLHGALHDLGASLSDRGGQLIVRRGNPAEVLPAILAESGAEAIYAEADYSPYARRRDQAVAKLVPLELIEGVAIRPVGQVLKPDGDPYTVFTPFSKRWKGLPLPTARQLLSPPAQLQTPKLDSEPLPQIGDERSLFPPTAAEAEHRLDAFRQNNIFAYKAQRDILADDGTSALSPYLRFGLLSARQAAVVALEAMSAAPDKAARQGAETWLNELLWREFYINILYHFPEARASSFRPVYDDIAWRNDESEFQAWCAGQTGYPIVDAG
ncbi:MAG: deoxyribodipyrimidine photo-lyase, partial [Anaerolineales bacterium]|nr:deoxyribodipyrimidine photo-lyase [Anaerolineales bacterium]